MMYAFLCLITTHLCQNIYYLGWKLNLIGKDFRIEKYSYYYYYEMTKNKVEFASLRSSKIELYYEAYPVSTRRRFLRDSNVETTLKRRLGTTK